jgi:hypothetical protein
VPVVITSDYYAQPKVLVLHALNNSGKDITGYITPKDMLAGRQQETHAERDRKLEAARQQRQSRRQQAA